MAYWPNLDGLLHFLDDVWPSVRRAVPQAKLLIVGRAMPAILLAWSGKDGIQAEPDVASVSPYYAQAHVVIVPLRFAVGANVKIAEGMAHGRMVLGYQLPCERTGLPEGCGLEAVPTPEAMTRALIARLNQPATTTELGRSAFEAAARHFSRRAAQTELRRALDQVLGPRLPG
jgi:glycosyltransferase involved in cell wall biosynthesis